MTRLFIKLFLLTIPVGLIVVVTNVKVDPANVLSGEAYISNVASILAAGNNAENLENYDERLLQKFFLLKQTKPADIAVMGSSRVMEIGSSFYPNKSLINIAVSHGNIKDVVALTGLMDSFKILPKEILLGVDQFLICEGGTTEWQSISEGYDYFIDKKLNHNEAYKNTSGKESKLKRYYTMLTFDYFKQSLTFLLKHKNKTVINTAKNKPTRDGRMFDGSIVYSTKFLHPDSSVITNIAENTSNQKLSGIDKTSKQLLAELINFYKQKSIKITLLLIPYHPNLYNGVNKNQDNLLKKYEDYYLEFAKQQGLAIKGSFIAEKYGILYSEFFDPYHCTGESIKKIYTQENINN